MAEYVTDYDGAMNLARGEWAQLLPEAIDTKDQTQQIVDTSVETMSNASAQAKQQIMDRLQACTQRFVTLRGSLDGLNATGQSAEAMRNACGDLSANVERLETALNEAFEELDREIVELGAEVSDVVRQFGTQFQQAGDLIEDGRTKWISYVDKVQEVHDTMITY
jgi:vacuolar-type H+-ATPase subunit I/STV1